MLHRADILLPPLNLLPTLLPSSLSPVVPGNCLRVKMLETEVFPLRVFFWKFPFLAWQNVRVLASWTKTMCAFESWTPVLLLPKGLWFWEHLWRAKLQWLYPTAYFLNPPFRVGNERLSWDYDPHTLTNSSQSVKPPGRNTSLQTRSLESRCLVYLGRTGNNPPKAPTALALWLIFFVYPSIYWEFPLCQLLCQVLYGHFLVQASQQLYEVGITRYAL